MYLLFKKVILEGNDNYNSESGNRNQFISSAPMDNVIHNHGQETTPMG